MGDIKHNKLKKNALPRTGSILDAVAKGSIMAAIVIGGSGGDSPDLSEYAKKDWVSDYLNTNKYLTEDVANGKYISYKSGILANDFPDRQIGYGLLADGWSMTGPAMSFGAGNYVCQMQMDIGMGSDFKFRSIYNGGARGWNKLWHSGNSNLSTVDWTTKNILATGNVNVSGAVTANGNIQSAAGYLQAQNNGCLIQIGSQNAAYAHITSSPERTFYFNTGAIFNGTIAPYVNNNYCYCGTTDKRWSNVYSVFGDFSDRLSADAITIKNTGAVEHLKFSRAAANYITAPENGYFSFIPHGKALNLANSPVVIGAGFMYPGATNTYLLGTSTYRWSNVYSVAGNFSGNVTIGNELVFANGNKISASNIGYFSVLAGDNSAIALAAHGITLSDNYDDVSKRPARGIYSKGGLSFDGNITTSSFLPGFAGSGSAIVYENGKYVATFDKLVVRGETSIYDLIYNQVTYVGGFLAVDEGGEIESISGSNIILKGDNDNMNLFKVNDLLLCQTFTGRNVKRYLLRVTAVSGRTITIVYVSGGTGANMAAIGDTLVHRGNTTDITRQGSIFLTSSDSGAPYIAVLDGINSDSLAGKTKVRAGKLNGITDPTFGALSGYGLYAINAYLTGGINASFGKIGSWDIDTTSIWTGNKFPGSGIEITRIMEAGRVLACRSANDYVMLYNYNADDWGISGVKSGVAEFSFGSTNKIAGWHFNYQNFYSGNLELSSAGRIRHIGGAWGFNNDGSGRLASGNIIWDAAGNVDFSNAVKLIWQTDINSTIGYKLTKIDANGIYTGTLTANQVNVSGINASNITAGTLSVDRIFAGSIKAAKLDVQELKTNVFNANYISSLDITTSRLTVTSGAKISQWNIDTYGLVSVASTTSSTLGGRIYVGTSSGDFLGINDSVDTLLKARSDQKTAAAFSSFGAGTALELISNSGGYAVKSYGSHKFIQRKQSSYEETWNAPGTLMICTKSDGASAVPSKIWGQGCNLTGYVRVRVGVYKFSHNLGHTDYTVMGIGFDASLGGNTIVGLLEKTSTYFTVNLVDRSNGQTTDKGFEVVVFGRNVDWSYPPVINY